MIGLPIHRLSDDARRGIVRALLGQLVTLTVEPNRQADEHVYAVTGRVAAVADMVNYAVPTGGFVVLVPDELGAGEAVIVPLSVVAAATMRPRRDPARYPPGEEPLAPMPPTRRQETDTP